VGKATGSRECARDDRLRVPTIASDVPDSGHGAKRAFAHTRHMDAGLLPGIPLAAIERRRGRCWQPRL